MRSHRPAMVCVVTVIASLSAATLADTLHVPAEYPTIQAAIDAAADGDIVELADGTYTGPGNRALDMGGKALTVRGASGDPNSCIIDCEYDGAGFVFTSGEGPDSIVADLTICHGDPHGVQCEQSSPTLMHCVIADNRANGGGGLRALHGANMTLVDCVIVDNVLAITSNGCGTALRIIDSHVTLNGCRIERNGTWGGGGSALCCRDGAYVVATDCVFRDNSSEAWDIIYCEDSGGLFTNCVISDNRARIHSRVGTVGCVGTETQPEFVRCTIARNVSGDHGTIHCEDGARPIFRKCWIVDNQADEGGAAVSCTGGAPLFAGCVIANNRSGSGGVVQCEGPEAAPILTNCTIVGNVGGNQGAAVVCLDGGAPEIRNGILWRNVPRSVVSESGAPAISYTTLEGGWPGDGNADADPRFAYDVDYHLMSDSPCIDSGAADVPGGLPDSDIDGNSRVLDGDGDGAAVVDRGAYEHDGDNPTIALNTREISLWSAEGDGPQSTTVMVRNASGGVLEWRMTAAEGWLAVTPEAGDSEGENDEVRIQVDPSGLEPGVYVGTVSVSAAGATNSPQEIEIRWRYARVLEVPGEYATIQSAIDAAGFRDVVEIADGVYSGEGNHNLIVSGKTLVIRSESGNPARCIIDCGYEGRGIRYRACSGEGSLLQGVTITHGSASDGAGIKCDWSSPTVRHCVIAHCNATGNGGGFYCKETSQPVIVDCTFVDNEAAKGGAIYGEEGAELECSGTRVDGNTAAQGGGAYVCGASRAMFSECGITNNVATEGGAVHAVDHSSVTLISCAVERNHADLGGGIFADARSRVEGTDSVINDNAARCGGGIFSQGHSYCVLNGWTFARNVADEDGGAIYLGTRRHKRTVLRNCEIVDNQAGGQGGGAFVIQHADPWFIGCRIMGNGAWNGGGVSVSNGWVRLLKSCLQGNRAMSNGGGLYAEDSGYATIVSSLLTHNHAREGGGASFLEAGAIDATSCTITGNVAAFGGAVACAPDGGAWLYSSVLVGDTPDEIVADDWVQARFCAIDGGWPGNRNIDADPLFVDADGPDDDPNTWDDNDYHLLAGSPCIDGGNAGHLPADEGDVDEDGDTEEPFPVDLDGNPRVVDDPGVPNVGGDGQQQVDMGAYEFQGVSCFADFDGSGRVDLGDLAVVAAGYGIVSGAAYTDGDLNRDGRVDDVDIAILVSVYGTPCP